ncbi:hypothetical protein AB0N14_21200 [Streptomyces sp. NPDC051104]|uniref:hypothetical protein n=1 Tax=Streptomyces sp. NPDC051104 TaxID=3155044 RepID=UPI003443E6BF
MEFSEVADAPESVPDPGPSDVRRSGRTTLLIAAAAVLGVVAGTCTGYVIQAEREPTALPPLSQPVLAQAKGKGPEPLSAVQDRRVRTDGDLRTLLLKRPSGAQDPLFEPGHDGWMSLAEYAETFKQPAVEFRYEIGHEFRRAAVTAWRLSDTYGVEIRLVQYRQEEQLDAAGSAEGGRYWAERQAGSRSWAIPGTGDGRAYVHTRPDTKSGMPVYSAEAHAWRGDIAMEIWIYDTKPISKEKVMDLAKRQVGRL